MAIVYFPSPDDCDVIEMELLRPSGSRAVERFFVDSGFTGESCLVLSEDASDFAFATVSASHVAGALRGRQARMLVICRIAALSFERHLIAITTDISSLSLPPDVAGMVGLNFLRHFARWGAERTDGGDWRFFLSDDEH